MGKLAAIDLVCLGLLGLAVLRGLFIGLIREAFSIAGLGAALLAVRLLAAPAADRLLEAAGGALGPMAARLIAAALLAIAALCLLAGLGRLLRRGAHAAGLGLADRVGGAAIGAAEGALAAGVLVLGLVWLLGAGHPVIAQSRSLELLERLQQVADSSSSRLDVASPPR